MLMEVKNQLKVTLLSIKYAIVREMLNKFTFITNVLFMILNNASFIIQWVILFSIKSNVGGYGLKQVLLLWGLAASTFGFSHFFFNNAYNLSETINTGKLDSYIVQPKNILLSCITSSVSTSALGDILYGYIMLFIYGVTFKNFILYTLVTITGCFILTSFSVILSSLSFWFQKSDVLVETGNNLMTNFATYPEGIFKGIVKIILYTIIPVGITTYIPVKLLTSFNLYYLLIVLLVTIFLILLAFIIFYRGLKRYSSSNLMIARI